MKEYKIVVKKSDQDIIRKLSNESNIHSITQSENSFGIELYDLTKHIFASSKDAVDFCSIDDISIDSDIRLRSKDVHVNGNINGEIRLDVMFDQRNKHYYIVDNNEYSFSSVSSIIKNIGNIVIDGMPSSSSLVGAETKMSIKCSSAEMFIDPDMGGGNIEFTIFCSTAEAFLDYFLRAEEQKIVLESSGSLFQIMFLKSITQDIEIDSEISNMQPLQHVKIQSDLLEFILDCGSSQLSLFSTFSISDVKDKYLSEFDNLTIQESIYGEVF